jgi:hypothetical protein
MWLGLSSTIWSGVAARYSACSSGITEEHVKVLKNNLGWAGY